MGQIQLVISLTLIGLFSIAIITFGINFAVDNSSPISIADDAELSAMNTQVKNNVSSFQDNAQDTYSSILNTTISPGSDVPQSAAPFAITPLNAIGVVTSILYVSYSKIFGSGTGFGIFLTTFIGILGFVAILFIYKTLRGSPD